MIRTLKPFIAYSSVISPRSSLRFNCTSYFERFAVNLKPVRFAQLNAVDRSLLFQRNGLRATQHCRCVADKVKDNESKDFDEDVDEKKLTLFQKFKSMYRDYWYVLIPVHVVTSIGWFTGFYYIASSGLDLASIAESFNLSASLTDRLRNGGTESMTGYLAIAYAMYKIFTPVRYTVTLGGTTLSINYLKKWGYIKPIPKKAELKKMFEDKRDSLKGQKRAISSFMMGKLTPKKD